MKILGVDPGVHGGLRSSRSTCAAPQLVDVIDIPVVGVGAKERVDVLALRTWLETHQPQHALIERAQAMPKQGASSGFKYGRAVGAIEGAIACCEIPLTIVEPSIWKKFHAASRRGQGSWAATRAPALSRRPRAAHPQERSRSR